MVTDQQVRRLFKLMNTQHTLVTAAAKAGMDEKTARPFPYPVIPNVKFDRTVENGTRTSTGEPTPIHR